ncbi:MAG: AAA-like domain-containing protein [Cyanobacteria bacterium P01_F01_bin.56]
MNFDLNQAVEVANQAVTVHHDRPLSDVEILVLKGAWNRDSYDQIAACNQYSTSYISQDIAPKLWKLLSEAIGEKVKKNSLREPLKRYWETQCQTNAHSVTEGAVVTSNLSKLRGEQVADADEGALPYPTYIHHPEIEANCYDTLLNHPGSLIRIKSPKLMGKSSLINCLIGQLITQGLRTVNLTLRMADRQHHFCDIDTFLRWFCFNVEQELDLESQLDRYWNAEWLGSKVSCTTYFEKYLLNQNELPLVLCIDDVDLLFTYPDLYEDFFGLLRSWYEKARSRPQWKKMRLILSHSTEAYIRLNINQSPFNVGFPVELPEFNLPQAIEFAQRFGLAYLPEQMEQLVSLLGGHPFLLEKMFDHLKSHQEVSLAEGLQTAPTQAGIYRNYLQALWSQLKDTPELQTAFTAVITADEPVVIAPNLAYQLQSMGLIKVMGNLSQPHCELYRQYFLTNA